MEEKVGLIVESVIGKLKDDQEIHESIIELYDILEKDELTAFQKRIFGTLTAGTLFPFIFKGTAFLLTVTNPLIAGAAGVAAGALVGAAGLHFF